MVPSVKTVVIVDMVINTQDKYQTLIKVKIQVQTTV